MSRQGTTGDIAVEHGVTKQRVHQWIHEHPDFPKALSNGRAGRLYNLDRVRAWAQRRHLGMWRDHTETGS